MFLSQEFYSKNAKALMITKDYYPEGNNNEVNIFRKIPPSLLEPSGQRNNNRIAGIIKNRRKNGFSG